MKIIKTKEEIHDLIDDSSRALVPTMGALHQGHLSLVKLAQSKAAKTWVSIFVNPLQFGPDEDFDQYPRTFAEDCQKLEEMKVDFVFAPTKENLYQTKAKTIQANPEFANILCGKSRPGHFDGVCTVVKVLLDLIQPHYAIFGEKDYQQLIIIKDMVSSLKIPTKITPAKILREANGLAMSSRNKYLDDEQKQIAANIYQELLKLKDKKSPEAFQEQKMLSIEKLEKLGIKIEYLETHFERIFIAAKLAEVRLIDNLGLG